MLAGLISPIKELAPILGTMEHFCSRKARLKNEIRAA